MLVPEFKPWPKIPRANKPLVITEKIDGTNAVICITEDGDLFAGSRTRWLVGSDDNFGFRAWCEKNLAELGTLGPGYHYGEWYGLGIQRGYGLNEKRFALFNTARWADGRCPRPACCGVVPILPYETPVGALEALRRNGSVAVPGFMKPEGIVVFHTGSSTMQKILLENDDIPKGLAGAA